MSAWHDPDRTVVDAFLEKSQFRPGSRPTYRWFLRSFEDAARRHPAVDRQMLDAWLKDMEKRWRLRRCSTRSASSIASSTTSSKSG
jgi:hypothetical protein